MIKKKRDILLASREDHLSGQRDRLLKYGIIVVSHIIQRNACLAILRDDWGSYHIVVIAVSQNDNDQYH